MAEVAVNLVMEKITSLLSEDVELLRGVHEDIEDIKVELEFITCFLKEADARAVRCQDRDSINTWVRLVRETAFRIEDALDDYILLRLHVGNCRREQQQQQRHGFIKAYLCKLASFLKSMKKRHEIASELQAIKRSVCEIGRKRKRYGLCISETKGSSDNHVVARRDPRVGLQFVQENALVGIDSLRNELVYRLISGPSVRAVVSLVGMGGIGKTTLARKVYEDQTVIQHFDCHAWVTVSQSFQVEALLRNLLRRFYESRKELPPDAIGRMDEEELISKSREYLLDKRYVAVFDDVWNQDFWRSIEHVLLDNNKGCRIIITTRNTKVAEFCKESSLIDLLNLKPLPMDLAQELLYRTAFRFDPEKHCPPELKELYIVRRCEGLPLAIVAIGGLLSTKGKDVLQWENLHNSFSAEFDSNPHLTDIKKILEFSYLDLPYHLKSCFLFLGMFPEDYSIRVGRLFRLWIAEGFVKQKQQHATSEEVARGYLIELIHRSLVQVESIDSMGRVRECRVHDVMREVILSKWEELNLIQTSVGNLESFKGKARHLSLHGRANNNFPRSISKSQAHSIIAIEVDDLPESLFNTLSRDFTFLKELDFEGAPLSYVPEELGDLLRLRYLSLRDTKVKMLPQSIRNLHNLQTLDLKRSLVHWLPAEINKLCNLQYLAAYCTSYDRNSNFYSRSGVKMSNSFANLECLEKLFSVGVETLEGDEFFIELGRLKQLKKLGISKLKPKHGLALCTAIEQMNNLQSLSISCVRDEEFLQLQSMSCPPTSLRSLCLRGRLTKVPNWVSKLQNLVRIGLHWSRISDDSLKILGVLPNLLKFQLANGYDGAQLHFEKGYFQRLKELALRMLNGLHRLTIDEGAFPSLEQLSIGPSPYLEELPWALSRLNSLKHLAFHNMPNSFARRLVPKEGADHWKVEHVPNVFFYCTNGSMQCYAYKLGDQRLLQLLH